MESFMPRDVLIVLGARVRRTGKPSPVLGRRLAGAVEAARRCRAPLFLVMGGAGGDGPAEADVMWQSLRERGIPAEAILREPLSRDTLEQTRRAAAILDRLPEVGRVLVCTSPFHQPRCVALLRMLGVPAEAPPMPGDRAALGLRRLAYYAVRELVAVAWDMLLLTLLRLVGRGRLATPLPAQPSGDPPELPRQAHVDRVT